MTLDLEIMARQIKFVERVVTTGAFSSLLKARNRIPRNVHGLDNIDHAKEIAKDRLYHCFHPVGMCTMLPREIGGVVDSGLRVYETRNLRVVDVSVFPLEPCGNIQATVYAAAERAADLIRRRG